MKVSMQTKMAVLVLSTVLGAAGWAAPKGGQGSGRQDGPPPSSNRQSLPDADRSLDRADERRSEEQFERSRAREQQLEHPPNRGYEHRNEHSMQEPGHQGQGQGQGQGKGGR